MTEEQVAEKMRNQSAHALYYSLSVEERAIIDARLFNTEIIVFKHPDEHIDDFVSRMRLFQALRNAEVDVTVDRIGEVSQ